MGSADSSSPARRLPSACWAACCANCTTTCLTGCDANSLAGYAIAGTCIAGACGTACCANCMTTCTTAAALCIAVGDGIMCAAEYVVASCPAASATIHANAAALAPLLQHEEASTDAYLGLAFLVSTAHKPRPGVGHQQCNTANKAVQVPCQWLVWGDCAQGQVGCVDKEAVQVPCRWLVKRPRIPF